MMNDENRRLCYIILVGLLTLFLTLCVLYDEAAQGRWKELPTVEDASTRVNGLIAEIPTCVKSCIFNRITSLGCAHNDYKCLCREFERLELEPEGKEKPKLPQTDHHDIEGFSEDGFITDDINNGETGLEELESKELRERTRDVPDGSNSEADDPECFSECIELCANGAALFWVPSQILEVCDAVEEHAHLPEFMLKTLALYNRQRGASGTFTGSTTRPTPPPTPTTTTSTLPKTPLTTITSFSSLAPGLTAYTTTVTGTSALVVEIGFTGTAISYPTFTPMPQPDTGLPLGAKIGIGVAIPLILILLAMICFFLLRRRRKRRDLDETNRVPELTEETSSRKELDSGAFVASKKDIYAIETAVAQIHELDRQEGGEPRISELKGDTHIPVSVVPLPDQKQQVNSQRYELTDTDIENDPPKPLSEMPHPYSPATAVTRKPLSPISASTAPVSTHFPAPWETTAAESAFSAVYLGPGATKGREEEDQELKHMEEEMARLKEEKDRLRRMQSLEVREKELRRDIEAKKRASGKVVDATNDREKGDGTS